MSYILDALKKKETENSEAVPDIKSQHYHSEFEDDSSVSWRLIGTILAFLFLLAMVIVAYHYGKQTSNSDESIVTKESQKETETISQDILESSTNSKQAAIKVEAKPIELNNPVVQKVRSNPTKSLAQPPVSNDINLEQAESQLVAAAPSNSGAESIDAVSNQNDLITNDFSALPSLRYTSHIYADDAKDRFVMLNGRALGIGQRLPNGVKVIDILEDDLVVSYQGKSYQIPSLSDIE